MKASEVPQDDSILEGRRRACYAEDAQGRYVVVASRGWEVERIVNEHARDALREELEAVRLQVVAGKASVLAYHMTACQMDYRLLAANTGLARFRVRRHLRPRTFARLPPRVLERYGRALGLPVEALLRLPGTDR